MKKFKKLLSANATTLTVGKSTNLVITTSKAAGKFTVTSSNPSVASVSLSSTWVDGNMDDKITIKGVKEGTATITVTPTNVSDDEYNLLTNTKSIKITVKKASTSNDNKNEDKDKTPAKSSDATLKSITLENGSIDFSPNTTKYTVNVDKTVTSLGLKAVANSSKAKVVITGDENFKTGVNLVTITVTAENGATKIYEITVIKSRYGSGPLLDLKVKGYDLSPEFDPSVTTYSVDAVGITEVELEYVLTDNNSTVEITGDKNLKVGKNEVVLKVTEVDGTVTSYKINVNVAPSQEVVEEQNNIIWLIIIIILILLVVAETAYIIYKKKKENK